ncbi:MAG: cyclic pyranopterin monophosphate synthase MoaC [Parvularculaceae bacterium]
MDAKKSLSHFDDAGRPRMVDVSHKDPTARAAIATGLVRMSAEALEIVRTRSARKGDAAFVAELAGVMAAKRTADLIPLCHPLPLTEAKVETAIDEAASGVRVTARVKTTAPTGVEMEALTAVAVACLALYDMLKSVDCTMIIEGVTLLEKTGGASGDYCREAET